jgi:hypothetical protein
MRSTSRPSPTRRRGEGGKAGAAMGKAGAAAAGEPRPSLARMRGEGGGRCGGAIGSSGWGGRRARRGSSRWGGEARRGVASAGGDQQWLVHSAGAALQAPKLQGGHGRQLGVGAEGRSERGSPTLQGRVFPINPTTQPPRECPKRALARRLYMRCWLQPNPHTPSSHLVVDRERRGPSSRQQRVRLSQACL